MEKDIARRLMQSNKLEENIAAGRVELEKRIGKVELQESRLSCLVEREKQLAEHERLVEMRNKEINIRSAKLHAQESTLKENVDASDARIKGINDRYQIENTCKCNSLFTGIQISSVG